MRQLFTFFLILGFNTLVAQQFYNYFPSSLNLYIYPETDVAAAANAFYKIETESDITMNFRSNIRIVKTRSNGTVIWIKRYDAGSDSSIVATSINKTLDNQIIVTATLDKNNSFPPVGVTVFKLDTAGTVLWSVVFPGFRWGNESKNTIQLPDSTYALDAVSINTFKSVVIRLNKNGTGVSAKAFQNTVYSGDAITSMRIKNNTVSITFEHGEFITTDTAFNILSDKKYNLDPSMAYFTHTVTANGDYVFLSDIVGGGVLSGRLRIFRTTHTGELIWARSLSMWSSFTVHEPYTIFDVVKGVEVTEDASMNLVAHLIDEGNLGLAVTFDGNGNYLANKLMKATAITLCDDGDFLFASNSQSSNSIGIFAKQSHYSINDCDSLVDVIVSNGTDSASIVTPLTSLVSIPISLTNYPIHVSNAVSVPDAYCPTVTGLADPITPKTNELTIFPNPVANMLTVNLQDDFEDGEIKIMNIPGKLFYKSITDRTNPIIDISGLPKGIYIIEVVTRNNISRNKFIKQ